jgi:hypothetical protein
LRRRLISSPLTSKNAASREFATGVARISQGILVPESGLVAKAYFFTATCANSALLLDRKSGLEATGDFLLALADRLAGDANLGRDLLLGPAVPEETADQRIRSEVIHERHGMTSIRRSLLMKC